LHQALLKQNKINEAENVMKDLIKRGDILISS